MKTEIGKMSDNTSLPAIRMAEFQITMMFLRESKPTLFRIIEDGIICLPHLCRSETVYPPPDETTSININGTWTGIIGLLQRGEAEYAMAVPIDEEKLKVVDFLNTRFENDLAILSPLDTEHVQGDILDAFSRADWKVWLLIALGLSFMAVNAKLLGFRDSKGNTLYDYLYAFLLHLLCEGPPSYFRENALKVLALFYSFFIIVLDVSLFAYLKTNLVIQQAFVISSLEQMVKQKVPFMIVDRGDALPLLELGQDTDPVYKTIVDIAKKDPYGIIHLADESLSHFKKAAKERRVFIGVRTTIFVVSEFICMIAGKDMKYNVAVQQMEGSALAFPISRNASSRKGMMNAKHISRYLDNSGVTFHFTNLLSNHGEAPCFERAEDMSITEAESLELVGFRLTFIFWFAGVFFALIAFAGELLLRRMTAKKIH